MFMQLTEQLLYLALCGALGYNCRGENTQTDTVPPLVDRVYAWSLPAHACVCCCMYLHACPAPVYLLGFPEGSNTQASSAADESRPWAPNTDCQGSNPSFVPY